jgi:lipopolysaccharide export system protein LptC
MNEPPRIRHAEPLGPSNILLEEASFPMSRLAPPLTADDRRSRDRVNRDRFGGISAPRASAIPQARRHTARVARLRRWIFWIAASITLVLALALAAQGLRHLPVDLRFAHIGVEGSRLIIEQPKLVGYRKDGHPYQLSAKRGVQNMKTPSVSDLDELEVTFGDNVEGVTILTAQKGVYDSDAEHADLSSGVRIVKKNGYDLRLEKALMDFKTSVMTSDNPARLILSDGEVTSKSVRFSESERRATFIGDVHSVMNGAKDDDDAPKPQRTK